MMEFKDNLKYFRKQNNYSRAELAESLGVSLSVIGAYENGFRKPSFEVLAAISDLLNVSVDSLMGRGEYPNPNVNPVVLEMAESIYSNDELLEIIKQTPSSDKCRNCVIIQYLCEIIIKFSSTTTAHE